MKTRNETIRGLKTAWIDAGPNDAPILLFLHGFPDTAACWDRQIEVFAKKYRVIAPHIRGAAESEAGDLDRYSPDAVALDLLAILDMIDPRHKQKIFCVGHDLGAVHAWHLASLLQDRAGGVAVINGLTIRQMLARWAKNPSQLARSWYIHMMQLPLVPELLVRAAPSRVRRFCYDLGGLAGKERPGDSGSAADDRGAMLGPLNQYRAFLRTVPSLAGRRRQRLNCPVLVLFGESDPFLCPPSFDELSADARRLTVRIIPGHHWLHRDQADRVNALLGRFVTDSLGAPAC